MNHIDPKAETAVVVQAPFTTRVMFEDDESHLPEAQATPLDDAEMLERARAEEDLRRRRAAARIAEARLEAAKKATLISNPTWSTLPSEATKTYDVSAECLAHAMKEEDPIMFAEAVTPLEVVGPPPAPSAAAVRAANLPPFDALAYIATARRSPIAVLPTSAAPPSPVVAPVPSRGTTAEATGGFAVWIHTYRLPIIAFLIGVVAGVFIAFSF